MTQDQSLLMSMTETEAAALDMLACIQRSRESMRRRIDGDRQQGPVTITIPMDATNHE